uniref:Spermatogenesis-associated protein 20 n=1 Tax=Lygus hesperus TaxID=30085 RepID=A0A146KV46_LYGHE
MFIRRAALLNFPAIETLKSGAPLAHLRCSIQNKLRRRPSFDSVRTLAMASGVKQDQETTRNRLGKECSPYLLQHANNPVDWYPWGEEAFEKARKEDKLIFLSVGYSTCHWCHVMERESFEDPNIASIMNEYFVNIKVDREERPDVDKIYMSFVQASSGSGGWPMSVFMTPDLKPVSGGTYFPPKDMYGRPGFKSILLNMAKQWSDQRQKVSATGTKITELLKQTTTFDVNIAGALIGGEIPDENVWKLCVTQFQDRYEPAFGGFAPSVKFPQASNFTFLFHVIMKEGDSEAGKTARRMALHTLDKMADGGIHDHIAQGFARYSTDRKWHVPHFEKMLYDQAQLAVTYSTAYIITKNKKYADVVRDILTYVSRDLSHPEGGFFSAEDADSYPEEGSSAKKEGAFYVWTHKEIVSLLDRPLASKPDLKLFEVFCEHYHVLPHGNVNPDLDPHNELTGQNVLAVFGSLKKTADKFDLSEEDLEKELEFGRKLLYDVRIKRPKPHLDDKIITAWNGMMISGYSKASCVLDDPSYSNRAVKAANFIKEHLYTPEKKLLRSCYTQGSSVKQIEKPIEGFLDDYACVIRGLIDLYEATFNQDWLKWAEELQKTQDELFWDNGLAGYFTTTNTDSSILIRMKEDMDGAEPSGNSVAAHNLIRLSVLFDSAELKEKAGKLLSSFTGRLTRVPIVLPEMVSALMLYHDSPSQVAVTGKISNSETAELVAVARKSSLPGIIVITTNDAGSFLCSKNAGLEKMKPVGERQAAYFCRGRTCMLPVTTAAELASLLQVQ